MSTGQAKPIPGSSLEAKPIPTLTDAEMRRLHAEKISRVGIVAALLDSSMEHMLLLEHKPSAKTRAGMWGVLSETAIVAAQGNVWELEAPMDTVARALREEVAVEPSNSGQLSVPNAEPYFSFEWPVGVNSDKVALAICPIVVVDDELVEAIGRAPQTDEIYRSEFVRLDKIEGRYMRPGIDRWLPHALSAIDSNRDADLLTIQLPVDQLVGPAQDAILDNMYGGSDG